jgi:predicted RNase H-like HicB family nuclease
MSENIEFRIEVIVERDGKEFHAYCPAFKGLHASGNTKEEAIGNAFELAHLYLISLIKHKEPIPVGLKIKEVSQQESKLCRKRNVNCVVKNLVVAPA